jgi:hypothetical protein
MSVEENYPLEGEDDIPEGVRVYIPEKNAKHILGEIDHYSGPVGISLRNHDGSTGKETEITIINKIEGNGNSAYLECVNRILNIINAHKADTPTGTLLLGEVKVPA